MYESTDGFVVRFGATSVDETVTSFALSDLLNFKLLVEWTLFRPIFVQELESNEVRTLLNIGRLGDPNDNKVFGDLISLNDFSKIK